MSAFSRPILEERAQIVRLSIVCLALQRYAYKPVLKILAER
jgi:hypothetical protein